MIIISQFNVIDFGPDIQNPLTTNITDTIKLTKPIDYVLGGDYDKILFSHQTVENPNRKVTRTRRTLGGEVIK